MPEPCPCRCHGWAYRAYRLCLRCGQYASQRDYWRDPGFAPHLYIWPEGKSHSRLGTTDVRKVLH